MKRLTALLPTLFLVAFSVAQSPKKPTSAEIHQSIKKLNVLATAFYVAAHPDDENTRLISLLANQYKADVYYLSMTRGDGGQNLIGSEIEDLLGVIRTNELLEARKIDGGNQLFTRANDFGYSKTPAETMKTWDRQEVLSDIVWQIRKHQPDIIINRFNDNIERANHGHHITSAILSTEAFDLTGRKDIFPDQLKYVSPWQPRRLFFNTIWFLYGSQEAFDKVDKSNMVVMDAGVYFPWLGKSNGEIAAESRSMHRCQGMGGLGNRGTSMEYLDLLKGDKPTTLDNPFSGMDITWNRVKGGAALIPLIQDLDRTFQYDNPAASIPKLNKVYQMIQALPDGYWKSKKSEDVKNLIAQCAGLFMEAVSNTHTVAPGEKTVVTAEIINRSNARVILESVRFLPMEGADTAGAIILAPNMGWRFNRTVTIPENTKNTSPYWLTEPWEDGMYTVADQKLRGLPLTPRECKVQVNMTIDGTPFQFEREMVYKWVDPAKGELYRPFEITTPAFVNLDSKVYVFADDAPKKVTIQVKSGISALKGKLALRLPAGWRTEPASLPVDIKTKGNQQSYSFLLYPPTGSQEAKVTAEIDIDGKVYSKELVTINYDHIPFQTVQRTSEARLLRLDIKKGGTQIAYINGAGDDVASSLSQVGYQVTVLTNEQSLSAEQLTKYDAIVLGIRAYNTNEKLKELHPVLMDYVKNGGTVVVQYNTNFRLVSPELAPYALKLGRERVSEEDAEMRFLKPDHPVLNVPNKLNQKDFSGWVQERGLYYPTEWDKEHFEAILSANDAGEPPRDGGLLVAKYGDGHYVYTGLAFFRQLPSGVPGAYRLFANLLALKKHPKS